MNKNLPALYQELVAVHFTAHQWLRLTLLVCLIQSHRWVRLADLANCLPQTIKFESRRRGLQPTFRWIMQKFQGIHWVNLDGQRQISNLNDERRLIIHLFTPPVERYYYASG
ncbi:hypothetical protein [Phormidium yuhuli]|uniref:hypothetical protein n=1 Tax=Phormidium yuhuli TaxID=2974039 RepID=UPI0035A8F6C1